MSLKQQVGYKVFTHWFVQTFTGWSVTNTANVAQAGKSQTYWFSHRLTGHWNSEWKRWTISAASCRVSGQNSKRARRELVTKPASKTRKLTGHRSTESARQQHAVLLCWWPQKQQTKPQHWSRSLQQRLSGLRKVAGCGEDSGDWHVNTRLLAASGLKTNRWRGTDPEKLLTTSSLKTNCWCGTTQCWLVGGRWSSRGPNPVTAAVRDGKPLLLSVFSPHRRT